MECNHKAFERWNASIFPYVQPGKSQERKQNVPVGSKTSWHLEKNMKNEYDNRFVFWYILFDGRFLANIILKGSIPSIFRHRVPLWQIKV